MNTNYHLVNLVALLGYLVIGLYLCLTSDLRERVYVPPCSRKDFTNVEKDIIRAVYPSAVMLGSFTDVSTYEDIEFNRIVYLTTMLNTICQLFWMFRSMQLLQHFSRPYCFLTIGSTFGFVVIALYSIILSLSLYFSGRKLFEIRKKAVMGLNDDELNFDTSHYLESKSNSKHEETDSRMISTTTERSRTLSDSVRKAATFLTVAANFPTLLLGLIILIIILRSIAARYQSGVIETLENLEMISYILDIQRRCRRIVLTLLQCWYIILTISTGSPILLDTIVNTAVLSLHIRVYFAMYTYDRHVFRRPACYNGFSRRTHQQIEQIPTYRKLTSHPYDSQPISTSTSVQELAALQDTTEFRRRQPVPLPLTEELTSYDFESSDEDSLFDDDESADTSMIGQCSNYNYSFCGSDESSFVDDFNAAAGGSEVIVHNPYLYDNYLAAHNELVDVIEDEVEDETQDEDEVEIQDEDEEDVGGNDELDSEDEAVEAFRQWCIENTNINSRNRK